MKRIVATAAALLALISVSCSAKEKSEAVSFEQLPAAAKSFVQLHFPGYKAVSAIKTRDGKEITFDVAFTGDLDIEFDGNGQWTEVDCGRNALPFGVAPAKINLEILNHFPGAIIVEIERLDKGGYEVKLDNDIEVEFSEKLKMRK